MRAKRHHAAISQLSASPIRIADSTAFSLTTGSAPGSARHTGQVCVFGSAPNVVGQPQNIFDAVLSSTCTSSPSTGSNRASASSYGIRPVACAGHRHAVTSSSGACASNGPPHRSSSIASSAAPTL